MKKKLKILKELKQHLQQHCNKIINKAFNKRTKSGYDTFVEIDKKTVLEMFDEMKEFILEIKKFLNFSKII